MLKRDSIRRWKARCRAGRLISREAIENHNLKRWFEFDCASMNAEVYLARGGGRPS